MRFFGIIAMILLCSIATGGFMQAEPPLVLFVEDRAYGFSSVTDIGPNGVSTLATIFRDLGARVSFSSLREDLPADAQVVVLVRPRRALPGDYLARLWIHLEKGNHLLLALDPPGYLGANPDQQNGGLSRLLSWDYGISLLNGLIVKPWSSVASIGTVQGSLIRADVGTIPNPVIEPLIRYGIPVRMWGARPMTAELFGAQGTATSLLTTDGFAETNNQSFRREDPVELAVNIGTDPQGKLVVAAIGEDTSTNSRAAVFGDSESLENGFGLWNTPLRNPGNLILAQRIAAWLLELPIENWSPLPDGFTWLELDGSGDDWPALAPTTLNDAPTSDSPAFDIQQVRAFRDEDFLYLLVHTRETPNLNAQLEVNFDRNVDGNADVTVIANHEAAFVKSANGDLGSIPDARIVVGEMIEVRLPLRIVGISSRIPSLCLSDANATDTTASSCLDGSIASRAFPEQAPFDLYFPDSLLVTISSNQPINLRSAPSTNASVLGALNNGEVLAAVGRNAAGDWLQIQNSRTSGWVAAFLVRVSGDLQSLPVVE